MMSVLFVLGQIFFHLAISSALPQSPFKSANRLSFRFNPANELIQGRQGLIQNFLEFFLRDIRNDIAQLKFNKAAQDTLNGVLDSRVKSAQDDAQGAVTAAAKAQATAEANKLICK